MSIIAPCRDQQPLIPEILEERIPGNDAARFALLIARYLRLPFYEEARLGRRPYDRHTMVALILYGFLEGYTSPAEMAKCAERDIGGIWIVADMRLPSTKTFERVLGEIMVHADLVFGKVLDLCRALDMIAGERFYIDGRKTDANASKHKAMSWGHLVKKTKSNEAEIEALLANIGSLIADTRGLDDAELEQLIREAAEVVHRQSVSEQKRLLKETYEAKLKDRPAVEPNSVDEDLDDNGLDTGFLRGVIANAVGVPARSLLHQSARAYNLLFDLGRRLRRQDTMLQAKRELEEGWRNVHGTAPIPDKVQINLTDPDSVIVVTKNRGVRQAYNIQIVADDHLDIIVGVHVNAETTDYQSMIPALEHGRAHETLFCGSILGADGGYFSAANCEYCEKEGINFFVSPSDPKSKFAKARFRYDAENDYYTCPAGQRLVSTSSLNAKTRHYSTPACQTCSSRDECTKAKNGRVIYRGSEDIARERAREKALTALGGQVLSARKGHIEPVFGQMASRDELQQLHYRGIKAVSREVVFRAAVHNLRKILQKFKSNPGVRNKIQEAAIDDGRS